MKWRIFTPQLVAEDARRSSYVEVEADQMYIGYGGILQFLVRDKPALDGATDALLQRAAERRNVYSEAPELIGGGPMTPLVAKGLKRKPQKQKSICIRSFNSGYWADVELLS